MEALCLILDHVVKLRRSIYLLVVSGWKGLLARHLPRRQSASLQRDTRVPLVSQGTLISIILNHFFCQYKIVNSNTYTFSYTCMSVKQCFTIIVESHVLLTFFPVLFLLKFFSDYIIHF